MAKITKKLFTINFITFASLICMKPFHFVSLDNPFQPNYGGTWDIYYRLEWFLKHEMVHQIYYYHKKPNREVMENKLPIYSIPRNMSYLQWLSKIPFTVNSRKSDVLWKELMKDENPIWLEGIHTSYFLPLFKKMQPKRKVYLRVHNHEAFYYHELGKLTHSLLKKIYYYGESIKLDWWEKKIWSLVDKLFCISDEETQTIKSYNKNTFFLPSFVPNQASKPFEMPKEPYRLIFHGNFEIEANQKSLFWLLDFISNHPEFDLAIYGNQAQKFKNSLLTILDNTKPLETQLSHHDIFILPVFQKSGVKIKYLDSLRMAKPVLGTPFVSYGSGMNPSLFFLNFTELNQILKNFSNYTNLLLKQYQSFLEIYNNEKNFETLMKHLEA